jgi:hypothetical protein
VFIPAPAHGRHAHYLFAAALFAILGFHVGVWAVQLAPLSAGLRLDPAVLFAIGLIAQATSLRLALGLLVLTSLAIAGLATRWPGSRSGRAR